jgi:hypothetical protein
MMMRVMRPLDRCVVADGGDDGSRQWQARRIEGAGLHHGEKGGPDRTGQLCAFDGLAGHMPVTGCAVGQTGAEQPADPGIAAALDRHVEVADARHADHRFGPAAHHPIDVAHLEDRLREQTGRMVVR